MKPRRRVAIDDRSTLTANRPVANVVVDATADASGIRTSDPALAGPPGPLLSAGTQGVGTGIFTPGVVVFKAAW